MHKNGDRSGLEVTTSDDTMGEPESGVENQRTRIWTLVQELLKFLCEDSWEKSHPTLDMQQLDSRVATDRHKCNCQI
jgi:hypothetical protein